jgi:hypothetical protein
MVLKAMSVSLYNHGFRIYPPTPQKKIYKEIVTFTSAVPVNGKKEKIHFAGFKNLWDCWGTK